MRLIFISLLLFLSVTSISAQSRSLIVTAKIANVRETPSSTARIVGKVKQNDRLVSSAVTSDWYYIVYGELRGWIHYSTVEEALEYTKPNEVVKNEQGETLPDYTKRLNNFFLPEWKHFITSSNYCYSFYNPISSYTSGDSAFIWRRTACFKSADMYAGTNFQKVLIENDVFYEDTELEIKCTERVAQLTDISFFDQRRNEINVFKKPLKEPLVLKIEPKTGLDLLHKIFCNNTSQNKDNPKPKPKTTTITKTNTNSPFTSEYIGGNSVLIVIENQTNKDMVLMLGGVRYFIESKNSEIIEIDPGTYDFQASAPGVRALIGSQGFERGHRYTWVFKIITTRY